MSGVEHPPPVWRFVWGGVLAAAIAVAGNLWWHTAFTRLTGHVRPGVITPAAIIGATAAAVLLSAGIYLLLSRALSIATPLHVLGSVAVAVASAVAPMTPVMPDGTATPEHFALLAIPMHLWAGVAAAVVIPLAVRAGLPRRPERASRVDGVSTR
jgi:hypothetical protein